MRFRTFALGIAAVGLLGVATAAPSPAAEVKKFEGTIAMPAPIVSNEMAGHWVNEGELRQVCPGPGDFDGQFYKFFDLEGDFSHFFVSGPPTTLNEPDPTGGAVLTLGSVQDYDLDLYLFDAKCNELEHEGSINTLNGIGNSSVGGKKPARYAAVAYHNGPPNLSITLEASTEKIKK